MDEDKMGLQRF